jgi:hypothetical protein
MLIFNSTRFISSHFALLGSFRVAGEGRETVFAIFASDLRFIAFACVHRPRFSLLVLLTRVVTASELAATAVSDPSHVPSRPENPSSVFSIFQIAMRTCASVFL